MNALPRVETTEIPGLLVVRLAVQGDARGWFKEHWQREKMVAAGLPDFGPVQQNFSYNADRAVARGFHAEPWDKYVAVAAGRVYAAWVDMREGDSFGRVHAMELDESVAVFVPRGVANSYQTLTDATTYSYLVNQHWRPDAAYPGFSLGDPALGQSGTGIEWPIPLSECVLSEKDLAYGPLTPELAIARQRPLILGGEGQLARALADEFPDAHLVSRAELDLTDAAAVAAWDWRVYDVVLNAAAWTDVDGAESSEGRRTAWAVNATAPARLAALASEHGFTLVHYSSDYVFDGAEAPADGWHEESPLAPLGVYGQSKAAGDLAVAAAGHHYVLRTSWVIGAGRDGRGTGFVATMHRLAQQGVSPSVVDDEVGRLTFTDELARATRHLLESRAAWGTYNVSGSGPATSWYDVARRVFELAWRDPDDVSATSSAAWAEQGAAAGKTVAPRPASSVLDLTKLTATGFVPRDAGEALESYVRAL